MTTQFLEREGVRFSDGRAHAAQRITAPDLAELLGMDTKDFPDPVERADREADLDTGRGAQFLEQLHSSHPGLVDSVRDVIREWQTLGGRLSFGRASEISCFLMLDDRRGESIWPLTLYPKTGTAEVVFQHMRRRPVFDDIALRSEFRDRLAPAGIAIPDTKLNLRPSFPLKVLSLPEYMRALKSALVSAVT